MEEISQETGGKREENDHPLSRIFFSLLEISPGKTSA